jgi:ATP-dependent DNA ligase
MTCMPPLDLRPMEAESGRLPEGPGWQYEPKYDGIRCVAHRFSSHVTLVSKTGKQLNRNFPEVVKAVECLPPGVVVDGEIVSPDGFEMLHLRLKSGEARNRRLADEAPSRFFVFDLLAHEGHAMFQAPLFVRRAVLEIVSRSIPDQSPLSIGAATRSLRTARRWFGMRCTDGVVAKAIDAPYEPGRRVMIKERLSMTCDCVVTGLIGAPRNPDGLLLGLYDEMGRMTYVGRVGIGRHAREIGALLTPFLGVSSGRDEVIDTIWQGPLSRMRSIEPLFVVEVGPESVASGSGRRTGEILRWRSDKEPADCRTDQIDRP